ncbi:hypothetical protein E2C01_044078 [Portunus trituberculatus]|uniref:Uncharacterized protein n=1 Tax=Portunus trituberculatus TaxID=210409 RepID=A0A5B7FY42_PORTR|nr:hypothetical protein [Portunus trituberculatus]
MVAMAELSTQMSLCTCLPSCALPTNTYSKFPLAQLVVLRWWHIIGQKNYRHNENPIQQLPTNPSYKQMQAICCTPLLQQQQFLLPHSGKLGCHIQSMASSPEGRNEGIVHENMVFLRANPTFPELRKAMFRQDLFRREATYCLWWNGEAVWSGLVKSCQIRTAWLAAETKHKQQHLNTAAACHTEDWSGLMELQLDYYEPPKSLGKSNMPFLILIHGEKV